MCSNASIGVPWGLYEAVGPYGGVISVPRRGIESFAARIGAHYVCRRRREGRAAECENARLRARANAGKLRRSGQVLRTVLQAFAHSPSSHLHIVLPLPLRPFHPSAFSPLPLAMPSDAPAPRDTGTYILSCPRIYPVLINFRFRLCPPVPFSLSQRERHLDSPCTRQHQGRWGYHRQSWQECR